MLDYGFIVLKIRDQIGSKLYQIKSQSERDILPSLLSGIKIPKLQVITLSNPYVYKEYEPYEFVEIPEDILNYLISLSKI